MFNNLLKPTAWLTGSVTMLAALLYFSPTLLRGVDAVLGTSVRATLTPAIDTAWVIFPWALVAPALFAMTVLALWLLKLRARHLEDRREVRRRSTYVDAHEPSAGNSAEDEPALEEVKAIVEPPHPSSQAGSDDHPADGPSDGSEQPVSFDAGSDGTDVENRPDASDTGRAAGDLVPTAGGDVRAELIWGAPSDTLTEARAFIGDPDAVSDIADWVSSLVDASTAPFEEAVQAGQFEVGLCPESARVLYTGLLEQEAARRHAHAVEVSGLDAATITELTGR